MSSSATARHSRAVFILLASTTITHFVTCAHLFPRGVKMTPSVREQHQILLTVSKVLLSVYSLLTDCNLTDPFVGSITTKYTQNREQHYRIAKLWPKRYAT